MFFRKGIKLISSFGHLLVPGQDEKFTISTPLHVNERFSVLQQLKNNKSPGPDNVFTELLRHAGEELMRAIHRVFQKSWEKATVPTKWKIAEVKFLRKQEMSQTRDECPQRNWSSIRHI